MQRQTGGGGSVVFSDTRPTPTAHGGIDAGTTFDGVPLTEVIRAILYPYQSPAFLSFYVQGLSTLLEVGGSIPAGPIDFRWSTSNPTNVLANSIAIYDITGGGPPLGSGLPNIGQVIPPLSLSSAIQKLIRTSHTFRISALDTLLNTFLRNLVFSWIWRRYWGSSDNPGPLTEAQVKALANTPLTDGFAGNYTFPNTSPTATYKYISYASVLGTATSFIDTTTQLPVSMVTPHEVLSITNGFGVATNYNVHRSFNATPSGVTIAVS